MGSIHPTDFIIYDFNKKRLQFEGLFQRPQKCASIFFIPIYRLGQASLQLEDTQYSVFSEYFLSVRVLVLYVIDYS